MRAINIPLYTTEAKLTKQIYWIFIKAAISNSVISIIRTTINYFMCHLFVVGNIYHSLFGFLRHLIWFVSESQKSDVIFLIYRYTVLNRISSSNLQSTS